MFTNSKYTLIFVCSSDGLEWASRLRVLEMEKAAVAVHVWPRIATNMTQYKTMNFIKALASFYCNLFL